MTSSKSYRRRKSAGSSRDNEDISASSKVSKNSNMSNKSWNEAYSKINRQINKNNQQKIIYGGVENSVNVIYGCDKFSNYLMIVLQIIALGYTTAYVVYQSMVEANGLNVPGEIHFMIALCMTEFVNSVIVLFSMSYHEMYLQCFQIALQFLAFFNCCSGSLYLINLLFEERRHPLSIIQIILSTPTLYFVLCLAHLLLTFLSMDITTVESGDEINKNSIIIESVEHRKRKVFELVAELLKPFVIENSSSQVGIVVTDETGKPIQISDSVVRAGINSRYNLNVSKDSVTLESVNTAGTVLEVGPVKKPEEVVTYVPANVPNYNRCQPLDVDLNVRSVL